MTISVYLHNKAHDSNSDGSLLNDEPIEFKTVPRQGEWIEIDCGRIHETVLVLKVIYYIDGLENSWVNVILDTSLTKQDFAGTIWVDT